MDKKSLRKVLRNQRDLFDKGRNFAAAEVQFLAPLRALLRLRDVAIIAGYIKVGSEADAIGLINWVSALGKGTALPWLADRDADLMFRNWNPADPLEVAPFGFRQPTAAALPCQPDLILTPLLGFDRSLNRIGQGAGHYDRAFAISPESLRIGLAWSVQECDALLPDPWDMPMDAIITEKEWITGPQSRIRL